MERTLMRYSPPAGVLFPIPVLVSFAIEGSTPSADDPTAVLAVLFAVRLGAAVREHGGGNLFAAGAIVGGAVIAAGVGVDSSLRLALAQSACDSRPEAVPGAARRL